MVRCDHCSEVAVCRGAYAVGRGDTMVDYLCEKHKEDFIKDVKKDKKVLLILSENRYGE